MRRRIVWSDSSRTRKRMIAAASPAASAAKHGASPPLRR
jgi:hypothetical protein